MNSMAKMISCLLLCIVFCVAAENAMAQTDSKPSKTEAQLKLEKKVRKEEKIKAKKQAAAEKAKAKRLEKARKAELLKAKKQAAAEAKRQAAEKAKANRLEKARKAELLKAEKQAAEKAKKEEKIKAKKQAAAEAKRQAAEKAKAKRQEKARKAELLKAKKQAAEKAKRQEIARKAELLKAKKQAAEKAKREAAAAAKFQKEEKARLARLDAKTEKEAKIEIDMAKKIRKAKLAELDAMSRKHAKSIKAEKERLRRKFNEDKAKLAAESKLAKAKFTKKQKPRLDAEYKKALAELNKRYDTQSKQITAATSDKKGELTKLDIKAKEQAKQIKVKQTNLKRKLDKDRKIAKAEYEQAKKRKMTKQERARLAGSYKRTVNQLDVTCKQALADINDKAKAQATQTAQAKNANKAALAALDSKAKKQAKQIKTEKANLKRKLDRDTKMAKAEYEQAKKRKMTKQERARLDAQYKNNLRRLKAESKDALAKVRSKADAQASQIARAKSDNKAELEALNAEAKKQAKQIETEKANLKRKLTKDKADAEQQYKYSLAKTDIEYEDKLRRLESEYKEALSTLNEDAKTQTLQIAQAKTEKKAELAALKDEAKKQAKQIKAEKANLKRDLAKDKADVQKQYNTAKLDSEYRDKLSQLDEALQMTQEKQQIEDEYQQMIAKAHIRLRHRKEKQRIAKIVLSEDTTLPLAVKEIRISGNNLISTAELLEELPLLYNASDKPLEQADSSELYDLSTVGEVILKPGKPHQITVRTIQGLTQFILSVYQARNYGGIYVYVPSETLKEGGKLQDDILPIKVLEASTSNVIITHYDPENEKVEKGYLRDSAVSHWSPLKVGDVANRKELDEFVNLLNLNPDRYVSAVVSKGIEPNSLAIGYNIYEANPWHWFFQIDNSGTKDRRWTPRVGLINTNLLGIDDTFTAIYQAPWESDIDESYSLYGSYDFPLLGPRLRLNIFGGYNEFDISGGGGIDFLGNGEFYGGTLRYNVFQKNKWFFDVTGTLSHEESRVTPSLFPQFLGTNIKMDLWGYGIDIHHRDDMSDTSLTFNRIESFGGSDSAEFTLARTNAKRDFTILTTAANHSQYLDDDEIQRLSGSFRWITTDERLVPAKMTSFGGMYTVRGYDEYEIITDGGILASAQYEFDLVAYDESRDIDKTESEQTGKKKPFLRKLAPLAFLDYGLAKIEEPLTTEHKDQELCSAGVGVLVELGDNFSGAVYYGYPLIKTDNTRIGKGRLNIGLVMRW